MHELTFASTALMICVAAGAYLAGCCNGAIITSFLFYRDDIRRHGSHNAGLTNFYRVYGENSRSASYWSICSRHLSQ